MAGGPAGRSVETSEPQDGACKTKWGQFRVGSGHVRSRACSGARAVIDRRRMAVTSRMRMRMRMRWDEDVASEAATTYGSWQSSEPLTTLSRRRRPTRTDGRTDRVFRWSLHGDDLVPSARTSPLANNRRTTHWPSSTYEHSTGWRSTTSFKLSSNSAIRALRMLCVGLSYKWESIIAFFPVPYYSTTDRVEAWTTWPM